MESRQLRLFSEEQDRPFNTSFPSTRYQGSKRSLLEWIWANTCHLRFDSVLDVFGGTGAVSHLFKTAGKQVTYNDVLEFNWHIGLALIENSTEKLVAEDLNAILCIRPDVRYPTFIQDNFENIYFTSEENIWLDQVTHNINTAALAEGHYKRALARFCLFQACIVKRPYNLFHRANLYMRTAGVERTFGNKVTWDTPFETHFRKFAQEANDAVFDNGRENVAICQDALATPQGADLVYLDPPYLNAKGVGVDYRDFYHFLEGLVQYETWPQQIDTDSKHRRLMPQSSHWNNPREIAGAFEQLIDHHCKSILVISYRDDGIPAKEDLISILRKHNKTVIEVRQAIQYALAHKRSHEILLIAT